MPQHLKSLADRSAANRRVLGTVAAAFLVTAIVFGGFYLGSRWHGSSTSGATSESQSPYP
jgi:hypothetical protein